MSPHATSSLLPVPTGWQALHYAILSDDTLAVAATDVDLATEWKRILGSHGQVEPPSLINQLTNSGRGHVMTWGADGWQDGPVFPLETPHPLIDRFTDGRWLVVASRAGNGPNARVLTPAGSLLDRIMLGDGIEHITIDDRDRIWVGWFDEGTFGEGWSVPGMESSPSNNGVGCFMPDGTVADVPSWPKEAGVIADCYALAHNGSGVWTSPYTDFPLVHFVPGMPMRWWRSELVGPQAIAVDGQYALVAGGDRGDAARMALIELNGSGNGEEITLLRKWRMPLRASDSE